MVYRKYAQLRIKLMKILMESADDVHRKNEGVVAKSACALLCADVVRISMQALILFRVGGDPLFQLLAVLQHGDRRIKLIGQGL